MQQLTVKADPQSKNTNTTEPEHTKTYEFQMTPEQALILERAAHGMGILSGGAGLLSGAYSSSILDPIKRRARLIFVGHSMSGKTTLIHRLKGDEALDIPDVDINESLNKTPREILQQNYNREGTFDRTRKIVKHSKFKVRIAQGLPVWLNVWDLPGFRYLDANNKHNTKLLCHPEWLDNSLDFDITEYHQLWLKHFNSRTRWAFRYGIVVMLNHSRVFEMHEPLLEKLCSYLESHKMRRRKVEQVLFVWNQADIWAEQSLRKAEGEYRQAKPKPTLNRSDFIEKAFRKDFKKLTKKSNEYVNRLTTIGVRAKHTFGTTSRLNSKYPLWQNLSDLMYELAYG